MKIALLKNRMIIASLFLLMIMGSILGAFLLRNNIPFIAHLFGKKTISDRLRETQDQFDQGLMPSLKAAGIIGIPQFVTLIFIKNKKILELYASNSADSLHFIKSYPVKAASLKPGPKLRSGDRQTPEGIYSIESLNPNSAYYLSLRLNYPNSFDIQVAKVEGRKDLGGDIMIHGNRLSIGCIAIGDGGISELFHLAALTHYSKWKVLLSPVDLRTDEPPKDVILEMPWMKRVYGALKREMERCK